MSEVTHRERARVFAGLRITSGLALIYYQLVVVMPQFEALYGRGSMVRPELFDAYAFSPLFLLWDMPGALRLVAGALVGTLVMYTCGYFARWAQLAALPLVVSFHHANPFLIHEPQQLSNLLFVCTLFIPIEAAWVVRRSPKIGGWGGGSDAYERGALNILLLYLSAYYFFAAAKKLPDPLWLSGEALGQLLEWNALRVDNAVTSLVRHVPLLSRLGTWAALLFELSFCVVAFSPFRRVLLPVGVVFHVAIAALLDVGHFWVAMIAWYPLLLAKPPGAGEPEHLILYDGVCGLCHRFVRFVLPRDRRRRFRFAALQSPFGAGLLQRLGADAGELDTVYVVVAHRTDSPQLLDRSQAVGFVVARLRWPWSLLAALSVVPRRLADRVYDAVAARRYRLFGRLDQCPVPPPDDRDRFLES